MPLVRIDLIVGRTATEVRELMDAVHEAIVLAFGVPVRDRYQIVQEHAADHVVLEDTGLGLTRTRRAVVIALTSKQRPREAKLRLYELLCERLQARCDINPSDVIVTLCTNTGEDWSFGQGRAQFVSGELEGGTP
jgi:phenylpyruvate tautomerase PptA (4-oxalocrotonate tautomerase family)